jgi:hypothetical protein
MATQVCPLGRLRGARTRERGGSCEGGARLPLRRSMGLPDASGSLSRQRLGPVGDVGAARGPIGRSNDRSVAVGELLDQLSLGHAADPTPGSRPGPRPTAVLSSQVASVRCQLPEYYRALFHYRFVYQSTRGVPTKLPVPQGAEWLGLNRLAFIRQPTRVPVVCLPNYPWISASNLMVLHR